MEKIRESVKKAQMRLREILLLNKVDTDGFEKEAYIRYLQMQYHMTKGVHKTFLKIAANDRFSRKQKFREFLFNFALEEESHYLIAQKDLAQLDAAVGDMPLDVAFWWSYFNSIVEQRPFVRLGGTCVLENVSGGSSDIIDKALINSDYITKKNTRFLVIHRHEELPHGDEILDQLERYNLSKEEELDVLEGIRDSTVVFMRLMEWIFKGSNYYALESTSLDHTYFNVS